MIKLLKGNCLDLLRQLKDRINSSIMLITHDLGVIAEMADYVVVMYAGRIVEKGTAEEIQKNPTVIEAYLGRRKEDAQ